MFVCSRRKWLELVVKRGIELVCLPIINDRIKLSSIFIQSYLSARTLRIKRFGEVSNHSPIRTGVPQGALLGPEVFILFTSDLPRLPHPNLAIYANGASIFTISRDEALVLRRLQSFIDGVVVWSNKWCLQINPTKCKAMDCFRKRKLPSTAFGIESDRLPRNSQVRYLGVTLGTKLTFRQHFTDVVTKFLRASFALCPLIWNKGFFSLKIRLLI